MGSHVLRVIKGNDAWVSSLAFSPDGETLVSGSGDRTVRFWHARTGSAQTTFWQAPKRDLYVGTVRFDPTGERLAVSTGSRTVRLWTLGGGSSPRTFTGRVRRSFDVVHDIAFSPDGSHLAVAYSDGRVRFWNTRGGGQAAGLRRRMELRREVRDLPPRCGGALAVAYLPDGTRVAVADRYPSLSLWDPATGRRVARLGDPALDPPRDLTAVAVDPFGIVVSTAEFDHDTAEGGLRLWDPRTGESRPLRRLHTGVVNELAVNPAGTLLASAANVDPVHLWHLPSGEHAATLAGHKGSVRSVAFHPDGTVLATGADDRTIRLWDLTQFP